MARRFALQPVNEDLLHYGVKGMKWGVRRPQEVSVKTRPGKLVKTSGGKFHGPSEDAVQARVSKQKVKSSSIDSLSNKELQALVNRMNLEQQYDRLKAEPQRRSLGMKFAVTILGSKGVQNMAVNKVAASNPQLAPVAAAFNAVNTSKKK